MGDASAPTGADLAGELAGWRTVVDAGKITLD